MRRARSYSIVDHQLLHAGHLSRLSHEALALYLFFVVVGDRDGRSFYSSGKVCELLRLNQQQYLSARLELLKSQLIAERGSYTWVRDLSGGNHEQGRINEPDKIPSRDRTSEHAPDRRRTPDLAGAVLANLFKQVGP